MAGWLKLHRSIREWEWYDDINVRLTFLHCLVEANFKDKKFKGTLFPRGSFPCGRDQLAKDIGITTQQLRTAFNKLKSTGEITTRTTSKGTSVTVCNYDSYQEMQPADNQQSNQQVTNNQPASNHSIRKKELKKVRTTTNEDKTETQKRVGALVKRRESTKWSDKEKAALRKLNPSEEDIAFLESQNYANHTYRRKDLMTLLNHWNGELDRMNSKQQHSTPQHQVTEFIGNE